VGKRINRTNKKTKIRQQSWYRYNNMLAASLVALCFIAVGLYGYLTKSFEDGGVYVVLTEAQAFGVLFFAAWWQSVSGFMLGI
jgi:hypothetical protein